MPKINYVIATWTGHRRKGNEPHRWDKAWYLKEHLRMLGKYQHSLDQITVVAPYFNREPAEVTKFLEDLDGTAVSGTPVVVLRRENRGHSYGSYSHVYEKYRDAFDYYILVEDDCVFVKDNFDQIMVNLFLEKENCGFLCCLVDFFGKTASDPGKLHAAISNGIASKESLEKVWRLKGEIPSSKFTTTYHCQSQLQFSWGFIEAGLKLQDFTNRYNVIFNETGELQRFGSNPEHLMIALQFKALYPKLF